MTDLARPSVLASDAARVKLAASIARDGSTTENLRVMQLGIAQDGSTFVLELGASSVERVMRVVAGRLRHGRSLVLLINDSTLELRSGARIAFDEGVLKLTGEAVDNLARLQPRRGTYAIAPGLVVRVHPTTVHSADGKSVVSTVG